LADEAKAMRKQAFAWLSNGSQNRVYTLYGV